MYQHCQNPFAIKQKRKSVDLSPKPCFWASKQLFAIHFLLATCNVCPLTIPEFFVQTRVSDYWQLNHRAIILFTQHPHYLCYFFSVFERSVLMALVFYYKDILEKVTMQRTQQFSAFSLLPKEPS